MQSSDARLRSFTQKSRFWPHTGDNYKATPGALAEAGFYWKPALSSPDNVVCFLCGKSLDGWTDTDDPFDEHLSHSRHCGWAIIKSIPLLENDQLPFRWDDEDELPKGERMTKARLDTFGNWWPHESEGWYGTTRRMANAGFYYAPTDDSKDNVQCPYCWLGLDGWESNDDPIHEHQRRKPTCPFFATRAAAPTKASAAKATKNKRKETLLVDNRSSNEQSLLLSPKLQRVHTPVAVMDKPSLRKNPRVGRIVKSSTPSPSPFIAEEDSTAETSQQPTTILKSESKKVNSKSSSSSSSSSSSQSVRSTRLVGFDLPDTTTIEPVISTKEPVTRSKAKAAPEKTAEIVKANVPRRGSQRNSSEVEDSEATNNPSQNTELEQSSEANSRSSSTAGRKRQKQQQQGSEDDTSNTSIPRQSTSSTISVVVPKKRRLTKAEQVFNRQQQNEAKSEDDQDKENVIQDPTSVDAPNIENPKDKLKDPAPVGTPIIEDYKDNSDVSSTISVKPRQRRVRKTKKSEVDNDSDQSTQSRDMNESNTSQTTTKRRGRSKKILGEEERLVSVLKSKKVTLRSSKRGPRSVEHLTSPLKKKTPKALIEIFELPDEPEQGQEEPASSTMDMESKLQDSNLISEALMTKDDTTDGMSTEITGLVSTSPRNNNQHAPESVVTSSHAPSTSPQNMEIVEPALEERESTPINDDEGLLEHPTTPVRRQAVSMQDIENAKVVIVDSTTPARRAASSMDIEGWEDEDRRESTQSRLSSPFISPSKWGLDDSSLTTSTPKEKKLPMEPIPSISQRHKIKDVLGDLRSPSRHAHIDLSHSSHLKSPASKKTPRAEILSPEVKQQKLIDRLDNLMQEDDSSVVLAVAESALKEEVKLLRRSQNKEKKLAAAAAAASQSTTRENSEAPEDEDIHMQEPETINTFMQTPVKKAGMSVTFESNLSTTPINNKTPLPISNVISAIGAASRRNHNVAASPFVKTPVKKTVDLIRLEDLEVRGNGTATVESLINEDMSVSKNLPELKSVNPFSVQESTGANQSTSGPDSSKLYWERQRQNQMSRDMETEGDQEQETISKVLKPHEDSKENERRLRLMKESGLSEAELKMTVEEFHRVILEEQVRRLELAGEAWIQRFQEESDRVRKALLEDFSM
ncbi:hypothetical protein BGZ46_008873, partial [Entomortierella lignicola]